MKIGHVYSPYNVPRVKRAFKTWGHQYKKGVLFPLPFDNDFKRSSRDIGDSRCVPFIKDMLSFGLDRCEQVILTNADISFVEEATEILSNIDCKNNYYCHRFNLNRVERGILTLEQMMARGRWFEGVDLIMIDRSFDLKSFPDLLIGYEGWDWVFRFSDHVRRLSPEIIWHEQHGTPYWLSHRDGVGNQYNRKLCREWVATLDLNKQEMIYKKWKRLGCPELTNLRVHS